jgi:signal transduction histidine kinase/ligand-binding sensor domain-containing protein
MTKISKLRSRYLSIIILNFIFLFLFSESGVSGQPKRLRFVQLTPDDGLSSSIITCISQDFKGLVWIGTPDGLNRYDGLKFVLYKHNINDSTSLSDNVVQTLFEDHDKNLFVGTEHGLSLYDRKKDRFLNYMSCKSSPLNGIACTVAKIAEDDSGNFWLASDVGLIYFDRTKNTIIQYIHKDDNPESLSDNNVQSVLIDKKSRLWATTRRGLNLFLPEKGSFKHFKVARAFSKDLSNIVFRNITEDRDGNIWIGSREGLFCLAYKGEDKEPYIIHYQHDNNDKNSLSIDLVNSLFIDDADNLWVGTENGGINLYDRKNKKFWHYRKDDYDPQCINNESIESISEDKAGNLWFGTYTGGINIAMKNRDAIIKYQNLPGAPFSLSHNTVTCFLEDHKDQIWVGTDGGGLNLFDEQTNRFRRYNMDNTALTSNSILCISEDSKNQIWLGTWAGGMVHLDPGSGAFKAFTTKNSGIQDNNIFAVLEGFDNDLWLGSFEHGLIHYQIKQGRFTDYTPENSGAGNEMIIKIVRFSKGRILIGTTENFQIFSPVSGQFITYAYDPNKTNSLSHPRVTDILADNDSCIWIGTPDGLNRFNPVTGSFTRYYEKDGLPDNFIKGLILDNSGMLWVTTNNGACRFDSRHALFKNFTRSDGLQSNEFNERSILKMKNGELLLGGIKGLNIVYPEKIRENKTIPDILITDLKVFNKSVKPGGDNSVLSQNITETKAVTLTHKSSVLTFSFAVMDFSAPEKNKYAYMMENFDKDWILTENKEATYTNLNPGNYIFRVKGSNNDGLWNETGTSIRITILPPWWNTVWFRLLFVCSIILLFTLFFLSRVRSLKKQKILLEKTVAIKTAELKELNASKDKFFSIIAHDLKNPFSTIIGFSEILKEDLSAQPAGRPKEYSKMIYTSAVQTFRLLENLLEWANSQRGNIVFKPHRIKFSDLLNEELKTLNETASGKNIEISCEVPENLTILADKNMLKTILRNLISNAIKFTRRNGKVTVKASFDNKNAQIEVSDNGIGMSQETILKLFRIDANLTTLGTEKEKGTGLGLFLCKEFVDKHGGKIWVTSETGNGTSFFFTIPLNH